MGKINVQLIQADIIFKALYYVAREEKLSIPSELEEIYSVLAERNPYDTHAEHTIEVMEYLRPFIRNAEEYAEYFEEEEEEEEEIVCHDPETTSCDDCGKDISLHTYYATGGLCVACSMN